MATFVVDNNLEANDVLDSMRLWNCMMTLLVGFTHVKCFQTVEEYTIKGLI